MEFSRQEYWGGLPFPSPGDLPDPGIKPGSPALQEESSPSEPQERPIIYWVDYHSMTRLKKAKPSFSDPHKKERGGEVEGTGKEKGKGRGEGKRERRRGKGEERKNWKEWGKK